MNEISIPTTPELTFGKLDPDKLSLAEEETIMTKSIHALALALRRVRDGQKWREKGYKSFADYCERRMKFTESRASQIMSAMGVMAALTEAAGNDDELKATINGMSERAARELNGVPTEAALQMLRDGADTAPSIRTRKEAASGLPKVRCPNCNGSGRIIDTTQATDAVVVPLPKVSEPSLPKVRKPRKSKLDDVFE